MDQTHQISTYSCSDADTEQLELLVVQPTPFCNLDCSYCYLPDRSNRSVMTDEVLEALFRRLFESSIVKNRFTVAWHAGEPLSVSRTFYEKALRFCAEYNTKQIAVRFNVQTNATLINREWAEFLKEHNFSVGVSIDGPSFIHDAKRKRRSGSATHEAALRGISQLRKFEIKFDVIAVVTRETLPHADEFLGFFTDLGAESVGLNIEEQEGIHKRSSMNSQLISTELQTFLNRLAQRYVNGLPYGIREFDALFTIFKTSSFVTPLSQQVARPFRIVNVDAHGNFCTFSPELLGHDTHLGKMHFGNVLRNSFDDMRKHPTYIAALNEIEHGIERCRQTCEYFPLCGGGFPSNKYFENGRFDSTATDACDANIKAVVNSFLNALQ